MRVTVSYLKLKPRGFTAASAVMVDSIMINTSGSSWFSLDITAAVRTWQHKKNMGQALIIEVEDYMKRPLPASKYVQGFQGFQCSQLLSPLDSLTLSDNPILDVNTLEMPLGATLAEYNISRLGLRNHTSTPWLQNLELIHTPGGNKELPVLCVDNCTRSGDDGVLEKLEEIDYRDS